MLISVFKSGLQGIAFVRPKTIILNLIRKFGAKYVHIKNILKDISQT